MSRSWNSVSTHYVAVVAPDGVLLARARAGGCEPLVDLPVADDPTGARAVEALPAVLAEAGVRRGRLTILLSNQFLRLQLVPWSDAIATPAELRDYARIGFEQVYGEDMSDWEIRIAPERAGAPRLAAALPLATLHRLRAAVTPTRPRLVSVQPYLMAAFNRLVEPMRLGEFVFVLAEPARTCLLAARGGIWQRVRVGGGHPGAGPLSAFLEREWQILGWTAERPPGIYVHAVHWDPVELPPVSGGIPHVLALAPATTAPRLAMAAAAA